MEVTTGNRKTKHQEFKQKLCEYIQDKNLNVTKGISLQIMDDMKQTFQVTERTIRRCIVELLREGKIIEDWDWLQSNPIREA